MQVDDQVLIIWNEYQNQNEWQRHNEKQRAQLSSLLLVVSAALVALLGEEVKRAGWSVAVLLITIGVFGILSVMKYWERFSYHVELEEAYRSVLDSYFTDSRPEGEPSASIGVNLVIETRKKAIERHKEGGMEALAEGQAAYAALVVGGGLCSDLVVGIGALGANTV